MKRLAYVSISFISSLFVTFAFLFSGFLRTVSDTVLVDLIGADQAAAGEGWALTLSGALDLLILPFTGKPNHSQSPPRKYETLEQYWYNAAI